LDEFLLSVTDIRLKMSVTDVFAVARPCRAFKEFTMHVFLTGANGWVGSVVARELLAAGHTVTGLVRSREKADALAAQGITAVLGSIDDLELIRREVAKTDGVIHTAFGLDMSKIAQLAAQDNAVIAAFGDVFAGSKRPIVVTSGIFLLPAGEVAREDTRQSVLPDFPRASEQSAFALAERGLHACAVRLPRSVHGQGEAHGFVPMLAAIARAKGVSAYVGTGENLWPSVHRRDAARVFRLALESAASAPVFHAIAEEGVPFRLIAEAIGRQAGVPARSLTTEEAVEHFGALAMWVAGNGPASSAKTRALLAWEPRETGLVADIDRPDYLG
jgi:nucleoside-diphosphate-sugar epimerase